MTLKIGETYFFRNPAADSYVGKLKQIIDPFTVEIDNASWVADSGRLSVFVKEGKAPGMEIEPVGNGIITRYQAVIPWPHKLFTKAIPE